MPIPLQTLITLPLYNRLYMYNKPNVSGNEKNVKPPLEKKTKIPPHCPRDSNLKKFQASGNIVTIQEI